MSPSLSLTSGRTMEWPWYRAGHVIGGSTSSAMISPTSALASRDVIGISSSSSACAVASVRLTVAHMVRKATRCTSSNNRMAGSRGAVPFTCTSLEWIRTDRRRTCGIPTRKHIDRRFWRTAAGWGTHSSSSICRTTLVLPRTPVRRILTAACPSIIISRINEGSHRVRCLPRLRARVRGAVMADMVALRIR